MLGEEQQLNSGVYKKCVEKTVSKSNAQGSVTSALNSGLHETRSERARFTKN